jgi:hypothetical protein
MTDGARMIRRTTTYLVTAFLLGPLLSHALARGRSFPIEVTGTVASVDKARQTFRMQTDEPVNILTVGVRWDCKFKRDGALAGPDILRKGAYVKVSYFAAIFTGNLAVEIEANPKPELVHGVIERIEPAYRQLTLGVNPSRRLVLRWAANARFISRGKAIAPAGLRQDALVKVSYFSLPFERKYAVRIELERP